MRDDQATMRLLQDVFPGARSGQLEYLQWLYRESPFGEVVETNLDDRSGRVAHIAVVPRAFGTGLQPLTFALALNIAVAARARGGGLFTSLAGETLMRARENGVRAVFGVANANATPGWVGRLGFTLITPLPVTVLVPLPIPGPRVVTSSALNTPIVGDSALEELLNASMNPQRGLEPLWAPKTLAWRLAQPGNRYVLHRGSGLLAVSTSTRHGPANVAVLLALFADHHLERPEIQSLVRSACRVHRAPAALHAGLHSRASFEGLPLPARLRPSPLNLIFRWLDDTQIAAPHIGRFEFLDFDAY